MSAVGLLPAPASYPPADRAAALDARLGGLAAAGGAFSPRHCAELDRAEAFPEQMCAILDSLGLAAYYVPAEYGGALRSYEDLFQLLRRVARRDLTVAVAHGKTFLGTAPVWVAGGPAQASELGRQVIDGAVVSWALSEPGHGADLLAGQVTATRAGDAYLLDGAKWPINNATRGSHACVLARTDPAGGGRGFSLFLVRKADLAPGSYRHLPKVRTLGIRGADISGIAFAGARLADSALVGAPGSGIETVLRALQLTRTLCAALSLGVGEHALRLATGYAQERVIAGRPLIDRPAVRATLARSASVLLAAEAVTLVASRAIHALPGELSVISAVVKALVPTLMDSMIGELAELLGSRSFLDGAYADGAFGKIRQDHAVMAVFDGSTAVNRASLISQFSRLARGYQRHSQDTAGVIEATRLGGVPGPFDAGQLRLTSRTGCSIVTGLAAVAGRVSDDDEASAGEARTLAAAARDAAARTADLHGALAGVRPAARPPASAYRLAAQYEVSFAAAACLHLWEAGRPAAGSPPWSGPLWSDGLWPRACLAELARRHRDPAGGTLADPAELGTATTDRLVDWLADAVSRDAPISLCSGGQE